MAGLTMRVRVVTDTVEEGILRQGTEPVSGNFAFVFSFRLFHHARTLLASALLGSSSEHRVVLGSYASWLQIYLLHSAHHG